MQRTISAMVGKGSVNHNSRKFKAENVNADRSHLNIDYCNENIKKVYHELFDEALGRYNAKQTRADRKIENYYEKIRSSKQEKPFHELILQIGDKENMSAESENGQLARQVLDEYYRGFQERNSQLRVFSAHLHMDEATPHLHIDFVPFTTGSKRGLDTRVSLKQALAAQGFKGGSRSETEWNQWVQSEKKQLAAVMERYGIKWERKGTHEKHLSVLDYKKQQRTEEIERLENKITDKQTEFETLSKRIENFDKGTTALSQMQSALENAPEYQLSEPQEMGGTYVRQGDYFIPCLTLPAEKENKPIGVWGQRHKRYLREHKRAIYTNLLTSGKLNSYLADIDEQAEEMFFRLVEQMAEREGVTEQFKAANGLEWTRRMNNIRACAMELVNKEIIYN